ncbi:MAG: hypothetical protein IMF07_05730 [Proteobacteria bacterium]|nr:hypothetical protein [Pseudomonadota bacterium]
MYKTGIMGVYLIATVFLFGTANADDRLLYGSSTFCRVPRCDELSQENYLYIMNAEKLGLSDEQIKKLGKIKSECDREFIVDRAKLRVAKLELDELLKSDEIDMQKAGEKSREISELLHKITIKRIKTKVQSMMILTDEQREKTKELFGSQLPKE